MRDVVLADEHIARCTIEARAAAFGAGTVADVLRKLLAHGLRFGLAIAALEVRNHTLETMPALIAAAGIVDVGKGHRFRAAAEQHRVLRLVGELVPRHIDVEVVMPCQRLHELEVVRIATIPAAHGTGRQRQVGMHDDARRVEELAHAESVAGRAGAHRRVEREQARLEFRQRVIADRAAELRREQQRSSLFVVQRLHDRHAVAEFDRRFERFGEALLQVFARTEAIDHRFDRVLTAQRQLRHLVDLVQHAVDAHAHETLCAQLVEDLRVLALALANDGRQQHVALLGIERDGLVDHLADRLRFEREAVVGAARDADACEQQAQVVVDLGDRADGRSRVVRGRLLLDRDRRRQAFDMVDVRLLHHRQELPGVGGQGLDVAALALGVDRVERERRLARARQAGDDDQLVAGQVEVDVLQVVRPRATHADEFHRHLGKISGWGSAVERRTGERIGTGAPGQFGPSRLTRT
ncbi:hypothetical protein ACVWZN_000646 [Lysobacter sp. HA35]